MAASMTGALEGTSRYELLLRVASGGMATVYLGRLKGSAGFSRFVAIKRAHAHLVEDLGMRRDLIAEARLASWIRHPNVVSVQDVEELEGELLLVMDYVEGGSLAELLATAGERGVTLAPAVAARVLVDACAGLQAAHDARDEQGKHLALVHRDVSPQNILVGVDGAARLTDFGIAKVSDASQRTATGALKGKLAYMAPEYLEGRRLDQRGDVFSMAVVAWEALANERLFKGDSEVETMRRVLEAKVPRLSAKAPWLGSAFDDVLANALAKDPSRRTPTARALGEALEAAARAGGRLAAPSDVGAWVTQLVGPKLETRREKVRQVL
ncbi:MAG TPA: serine/threonine-protein kinase, partial [Minicystis sp.]|nr:serine/threonine-protein kinase [Minicystis sp.]